MQRNRPEAQSWMRMDLNLLKALYVLVEERNISRAAEKFFVTRSAMSKTLKRLRENLNDPILVRTTDGLVPTPKALKLAESLSSAIGTIEEGLISSANFNPALTRGHLKIAAPETFAIGVTPVLFPVLHRTAPHLKLESLHLDDEYQEKLRDGTLDFAIYFKQEYPEDFIAHNLVTTHPVVWCRRDHPLTKRKDITLEDICSYPKLAFHLPTIKMAELVKVLKKMEELEQEREVIFETSHLLTAVVMMSESDALMISTDYLFKHKVFKDSVISLPLNHIQLFDNLKNDLCLVRHERTARSPLHNWVIDKAMDLF